ncbi:hypothetical protein [Roseateles sp. P5_E7]
MSPAKRKLWWAFAGLVAWATAFGLHRLNDTPLEFNVDDCDVVTARQGIDIKSLRAPDGVDKAALLKLLNAYIPNSRRDKQGEWLLRGKIDLAVAEALEQRLAQGPAPSALRVNSYGGDERAAIRIANLIAKHQLPVIVDGVCGSACANYLLAPAPKVMVDGLVLMHGSPAGCQARLGTFGAFDKLGWRAALLLRKAAQRQLNFEERHPRFKALVELSVPTNRGDPSGATHVWRFVPARELMAAHPRLTMGPHHAEVAAAFRALLQANPALSDAYFPE